MSKQKLTLKKAKLVLETNKLMLDGFPAAVIIKTAQRLLDENTQFVNASKRKKR